VLEESEVEEGSEGGSSGICVAVTRMAIMPKTKPAAA
jgi:hypothetical protein